MLKTSLQAASLLEQRSGVDIAAKLRTVGLHQSLGMALFPFETDADKQSLLTDRDAVAGDHIARQAADIAAKAQHCQRLAQTAPAQSQIEECRHGTEQRCQTQHPGREQADADTEQAHRDGVQFHGRA